MLIFLISQCSLNTVFSVLEQIQREAHKDSLIILMVSAVKFLREVIYY